MTIENLEAQVQLHSSDGSKSITVLFVEIDIAGNLTDRERRILYNSARSCEISKILGDKVDIRYQLNYIPKAIEKGIASPDDETLQLG